MESKKTQTLGEADCLYPRDLLLIKLDKLLTMNIVVFPKDDQLDTA